MGGVAKTPATGRWRSLESWLASSAWAERGGWEVVSRPFPAPPFLVPAGWTKNSPGD